MWGNIKVAEKPAAEKPAAEKPTDEKPVETTPEVKKAEEAVADAQKKVADAPKGGKEESLSNLRKKLEEREKELEEIRGRYTTVEKEYNDYKSKPIELPEEHKTRLTKAEQERDEYLKEIRAVRIEKDPEFVDRYVKPIQSSISIMQRVAAEAGVDEAALKAGFGRWDENTFGEWLEGMTPGQKAKFSAAWMEAERLEQERVGKIADANKTWEEMVKSREAEAKSQYEASLSNNEKLAKGLIKELILDNESTKDFQDLPGVAEAVALRAARYEVTPEEVFRALISNQALARMHGKQVEVIKSKDDKIAELEKKIADQESFIKEHASSTVRADASGVIPKDGEKAPALWEVQIAPR